VPPVPDHPIFSRSRERLLPVFDLLQYRSHDRFQARCVPVISDERSEFWRISENGCARTDNRSSKFLGSRAAGASRSPSRAFPKFGSY
jgi:hypothetical protein